MNLARHAHARRRGHTIVEMMVVLVFFGLVIVMATRLVVLMQGMQRAARNRLQSAVSLERLAQQFQRDVQAASKIVDDGIAETTAGGPPLRSPGEPAATPLLKLRIDERLVIYTESAGSVWRTFESVQRVADSGAASASPHGPHRDRFRLPDVARAAVETGMLSGSSHQFVRLIVRRVAPSGAESSTPLLNVQASLGKDLRFRDSNGKEQERP